MIIPTRIARATFLDNNMLAELARRELTRRYYSEYLAYAYGDSWIRTRLSSFFARKIQSFIETDTGHAYDIMIIECPPEHGKSMTVSESLPSWYLGRYPEQNIILPFYISDPAKAPWEADYVDQWTSVPNGKNDDMVDATSQALARMIYSSGDIREEKEQKSILDIDRLFNPYGM